MTDSPAPVLPDKPKRRVGPIIAIGAVLVLVAAAAVVLPRLLQPGVADAADGPAQLRTVSIGVTNASDPQWEVLTDLLAEEGIRLETVNFTDYPLPNPALAAGETDLNSFQHLDYLSNHNLATGDDLQPISSTVISPLPLYSARHDSVDDIPQGAEIAIPNDPSNQGRAINVLAAAGLLELTSEPLDPTPADIDASASRVSVLPIDASQTPAALQSADGAVINANFARDAGIDVSTALYSVDPADPLSQRYLNVIAANPDDLENPDYLTVAELWHTAAIEDAVLEASSGTAVIQDVPAEELRERLAQLEERKRSGS